MTEKEWIKVINDFVKLNPKKPVYPNVNKYNQNSFFQVKNLFKSNLKKIKQDNYNEIFSNKYGKFISGQEWIKLFIESKNIDNYHLNLRRDYQNCNQKRLYESLIRDFFAIYYNDEKTAIIEYTEVNLDFNTRKKLEKIRNFLEQKEWGIYFSELQKLMHEQIINFLDWKDKPLNYREFNKILIKKLNTYINDLKLVENLTNTIQEINTYRNALSKASTLNSKHTIEWKDKNYITKQIIAWDLYYRLSNFINVIDLLLEKKVI